MSTTADSDKAGLTTTVAPAGRWLPVARGWHLIVALVGTATIVTGLTRAMTNDAAGDPLNGLIFTLSTFTVTSNILTIIVTWSLVVDPRNDNKTFRWLRLTTLVMITITGLVYAIVLAPDADPQGIDVYTNLGYHYIVPWATVAGFLLFGPRPRFTAQRVPQLMIIPLIWLAYTFIHGAFETTPPGDRGTGATEEAQNWYPYPFLNPDDPSALIPGLEFDGWLGVAVNLGLIVLLGLAFGYAYFGIDKALSKGEQPSPLTS